MNLFSTKIKNLRRQKNLSLRFVADFLDIDPVQLTAIEEGKQNASKDQVLNLANCLGENEKELIKYYLRDQISREKIKSEQSKRLENLSNELLSLDTRTMQVKIHKPVKPFHRWIKQIICYEGNSEKTVLERVFPDGHVNLVINLSSDLKSRIQENKSYPEFSHGKAWVVGVQEKHADFKTTQNDRIVAVQFTLTGFHAVTGIPLTKIKNCTIDADLIFGPDIFLLREQLMSYQEYDTDGIPKIVCTYILNKRGELENEAAIVGYISRNIDKPIDQLVHKTGFSHKHVIHLFKKHTGITPKYFQRINRFNNSLKDILAVNSNLDWADIVYRNKFYDQSHFIKEFRHFTGFNPQTFMETGSTCSRQLQLKTHR